MRFDAANLGKKNDLTKILAKENEDNGLSRDRHLPQAKESTFPVWIAAKNLKISKSQISKLKFILNSKSLQNELI